MRVTQKVAFLCALFMTTFAFPAMATAPKEWCKFHKTFRVGAQSEARVEITYRFKLRSGGFLQRTETLELELTRDGVGSDSFIGTVDRRIESVLYQRSLESIQTTLQGVTEVDYPQHYRLGEQPIEAPLSCLYYAS